MIQAHAFKRQFLTLFLISSLSFGSVYAEPESESQKQTTDKNSEASKAKWVAGGLGSFLTVIFGHQIWKRWPQAKAPVHTSPKGFAEKTIDIVEDSIFPPKSLPGGGGDGGGDGGACGRMTLFPRGKEPKKRKQIHPSLFNTPERTATLNKDEKTVTVIEKDGTQTVYNMDTTIIVHENGGAKYEKVGEDSSSDSSDSNQEAPAGIALSLLIQQQELGEEYTTQNPQYLGSGSFGHVFKVTKKKSQKESKKPKKNDGDETDVAVKVVLPSSGSEFTEEERKEIEREIDELSRFRHDNIVLYIDSYVQANAVFIVMEYVSAGLDDLIDDGIFEDSDLGEELSIKIALGVLKGLRAIKLKNRYHRDIKPGNILVDNNGTPKIADFGLTEGFRKTSPVSKILRIVSNARTQRRSQNFSGTPIYMAPEILRKRFQKQCNALEDAETTCDVRRVDRWAAAIVFLEMIPGNQDLLFEIYEKCLYGHILILSKLADSLEEFVNNCIKTQTHPLIRVVKILIAEDGSLKKAYEETEKILSKMKKG